MHKDALRQILNFKKGKSAETQIDLLTKSVDPICKRGYAKLNLSSLSKELGCDRTLLVHHFKSLEGLFLLLFRLVAYEAQQHIVKQLKDKDSLDQLKVYGEAHTDFFSQNPKYLNIWCQYMLVMVTDEKAKKLFDEAFELGRLRLQQLILNTNPEFPMQRLVKTAIHLQSVLMNSLLFSLTYEKYDVEEIGSYWSREVEHIRNSRNSH